MCALLRWHQVCLPALGEQHLETRNNSSEQEKKFDTYGSERSFAHKPPIISFLRRRREPGSLRQKFEAVWERLPHPVRRFTAWWVQPRVLAVLGAFAISLFVVGFHY